MGAGALRGDKGGTISKVPNHCRGRGMTAGDAENPNNVTSSLFFSTW